MVLCVQCLQAFTRDMGIDLGGIQISVPEQHLHHAQIGAVVKQVGSERMA